MVKIITDGILIKLTYPRGSWVLEKLEDGGKQSILHKIFTFKKEDVFSSDVDNDEAEIIFTLGKLNGNYFEIRKDILDIKYSVFIHKDIMVSESYFIAGKTFSVFKKIEELVMGDIYIGGDKPNAISKGNFEKIIRNFPTSYEIKKYFDARLSSVLKNYFENIVDAEDKYNKYMNKKISIKGEDLLKTLKEEELLKYQTIFKKLEYMLANENLYNEKRWQIEILQIILLLYPKYIAAFKEVLIKDTYNQKDRRLDFMLIGSNGHIDIIEIKRPSENSIISDALYRDNHIPRKELSATIMQIEKYIFYLNKWGKSGEEKLTKKYKASIPVNFELKITNPKGIIIMGREDKLSTPQKEDFEVIKRKYQNIVDIITYDELLRRLKFIVEQLSNNRIIS